MIPVTEGLWEKLVRTMRSPSPSRQAWLLLFLAVMLVQACTEKPQLPRLRQDARILAFGDSLTYGTGAEPSESYPDVLSRLLDRVVVNAGVPGETTAEGLIRLPGVLDDTGPDLVILCLGGNDFLRRQDIAQTQTNLARMIEQIRARHIPLLLVAVPQPRLILHSQALYSDLAEKYRLPIEKDIVSDVLRDQKLKSDPIHPNAAGYRKIAEALAKLLATSGAI